MFTSEIQPICDVCDDLVEVVQTEWDIATQETHCILYCHGDFEKFSISKMDIMGASSIKVGRAFTTRKIEERKSNVERI